MIFSIIIPTYNNAHTLSRALDSLKVQNQLIKEVIIVDDGSKDDTKQRVETYQAYLPIIYQYQVNQGPSKARNWGLSKVTGQYVIFLDADDALRSAILNEYAIQFAENPNINMLIAGKLAIHPHQRKEKYPMNYQGAGKNILSQYWRGDFNFNTDACAFRATLIESTRFPDSIRHGEDIVFFSHVMAKATLKTLHTIAVDVYYHADSLRNQTDSYFKEADQMVDLLFNPQIIPEDLMRYKNEVRALRLLGLAVRAVKVKQRKDALRWLWQAIQLQPQLLLQAKTLKTLLRLI